MQERLSRLLHHRVVFSNCWLCVRRISFCVSVFGRNMMRGITDWFRWLLSLLPVPAYGPVGENSGIALRGMRKSPVRGLVSDV